MASGNRCAHSASIFCDETTQTLPRVAAVCPSRPDEVLCTVLILQQQYLELLERGDLSEALVCLQQLLTPGLLQLGTLLEEGPSTSENHRQVGL